MKGGAAAAFADSDGDVAAVMKVDDAVIGNGDDETSTGWCFAVASPCAAECVCCRGINAFSPPGQRK